MLCRAVCIGKGLKIGDVLAVLVLKSHPGLGPFQLCGDGASLLGKISAAAAGAKDAPAVTQSAIPVRAGKSAINGKFIHLAAELFTIMLGERFV